MKFRPTFRQSLIAASVAGLMLAAGAAQATNGYAPHGLGTKAKGMAGAGSALPQETMTMASNPAAAVFVGNRLDVGLALFSPDRKYTVTGNPTGAPGTFGLNPRTTDSDSNLFLVPDLGYNHMLGSDRSVGVVLFGNGGMNTDYPAFPNMMCPPMTAGTGSFCAGGAGVDLKQLFLAPTYSQKIGGMKAAFGASLILAYQTFEATGIATFGQLSASPTNLSDKGSEASTGIGVRLGIMGEVAPGLTLAAAFQPKISMSEFDDYRGLFAGEGNFDIPTNWLLGLAWKTPMGGTLLADIQGISFSEVDSVGNPFSNLRSPLNPTGGLLGQSNGPGFGWDDMTIFKLGYQWSTSPDWTWRVGISHANQIIGSSEVLFNILAPAVITNHITGGFTYRVSANNELSVSLMHALNESVKGPNPLDAPGAQTVEIEMSQWDVGLSYSWKF